MAACPQVIALLPIAVDMDDELAGEWNVDGPVDEALVRRRAVAGESGHPDCIFGKTTRDARINDVDDAADRRRAEQERGRAAKDFDALGSDRIDGNGVVRPRRRQVEAAYTVGEHAHAVAGEAAKHGRRSGRTEAGCAYARLTGESLANAWTDFASEVGGIEHGDPAEDVSCALADAGDDHLVAMIVMGVVGAARLRHIG